MDKREKILASLVEVATAAYCGKLDRGKYNAVADQILALDVTGDLETLNLSCCRHEPKPEADWYVGEQPAPTAETNAAILREADVDPVAEREGEEFWLTFDGYPVSGNQYIAASLWKNKPDTVYVNLAQIWLYPPKPADERAGMEERWLNVYRYDKPPCVTVNNKLYITKEEAESVPNKNPNWWGAVRIFLPKPKDERGLIEQFDFSDVQAQEILNMRLQRLTGLEREKIMQDYQDIIREIESTAKP